MRPKEIARIAILPSYHRCFRVRGKWRKRGGIRIFPFYLCFSWRLIERCRDRGMLPGAMRFVAFRSDSGSGVINDIVGLIAFRRKGTKPCRYRCPLDPFSSKFPLPSTSPCNRWKMFQFRLVESPLSFSNRAKKKDPSRTNRITRRLNIRSALFRSEKILISIHMGCGRRVEGNRNRKYRAASKLTVFCIFITRVTCSAAIREIRDIPQENIRYRFFYVIAGRASEWFAVVILQANKESLTRENRSFLLCHVNRVRIKLWCAKQKF